MSARPEPEPRHAFRAFRAIPTRLSDNDAYGHVNNVAYYSFFDTAVNAYLIEAGFLDMARGAVIGLVVETGCRFLSPISFPETVTAGLRVARLGTSSVRYEIGLFRKAEELASAQGHFVHVYVDRDSGRPVSLPKTLCAVLAPLTAGTGV